MRVYAYVCMRVDGIREKATYREETQKKFVVLHLVVRDQRHIHLPRHKEQ